MTTAQTIDCLRIYRGRRTSRSMPGLVLVSVADDIAGARRCILDPRFDVRTESPNGFEWGYPGRGAGQLALAVLCDHFEANPHDIQRAQKLVGNVEKTLSPTEASVVLCQRFAEDVIAGIPAPVATWSLTTGQIRDFLAHVEGDRETAPCAVHEDVEPGRGSSIGRTELHRKVLNADIAAGADEATRAKLRQEINAFVASVSAGKTAALPEPVSIAILSNFVSQARDAARAERSIAPYVNAEVGRIHLSFNILDPRDRVRMAVVFGKGAVRAAFLSAEELLGVDVLRRVFGAWIEANVDTSSSP